jgi:hypothetical protein
MCEDTLFVLKQTFVLVSVPHLCMQLSVRIFTAKLNSLTILYELNSCVCVQSNTLFWIILVSYD